MKLLNLTMLLFAFNLVVNGQVKDTSNFQIREKIIKRFYKYTLKYPKEAYENGITGTIMLTFDLDSTCSCINIKQNPKLGYGCDEVALQVLSKLEINMKKDNNNKCMPISNFEIPVVFRIK